ncbi:MAG: type IX secretion system protein PorQ [Bacteroidaceae bacterium]|nr:type IX secretion system protein PorQ [Bacteroidaceae bacterium]
MTKILRFSLLFLLFAPCSSFRMAAQESGSVFNFLNLPVSAHSTALGGKNISLTEDDISLAIQNPALLTCVSDKTVGFSFMTYMQGCNTGAAAYSQQIGARGNWGVNAQFVGYGSTKETLLTGEEVGEFRPLDLCIAGQYSHLLSERWAGGVSAKFIYSHYGAYSSAALAADLGLNYYNEETDFSFSVAARNLGGQVKSFGNQHDRLPADLEMGFTKSLGHAPIRISVTMVDMTRWTRDDYFTTGEKLKSGSIFINHFVLGAEWLVNSKIYIGMGYNFRRAYEMNAAGSSHAAGLSFGGGINLKKFKFALAYAKYHVSAPTLAFTLAYNFQKEAK